MNSLKSNRTQPQPIKQLIDISSYLTILYYRLFFLINIIYKNAKPIGTIIKPSNKNIKLKKIWIGFGMTIDGEIIIDEGAEDALVKDASLLSKGVLKVNQTFEENSGVEIKNTKNTLIGRGVVNLSSIEIEDSKNSENTVVIHKDNLLIL